MKNERVSASGHFWRGGLAMVLALLVPFMGQVLGLGEPRWVVYGLLIIGGIEFFLGLWQLRMSPRKSIDEP